MPEKSLTAIPRPLREQYEKGLAALQRQNFDYAIVILEQVPERGDHVFELLVRDGLELLKVRRDRSIAGSAEQLLEDRELLGVDVLRAAGQGSQPRLRTAPLWPGHLSAGSPSPSAPPAAAPARLPR